MKNADTQRSLENLGKALSKLKEYTSTPITEDRDRVGIIQAFEFCFELLWKTIQKATVSHSKTVGSPKQAFQAAFELGWILENEHSLYLELIEDRNLTAHTYKEDLAKEILEKILNQHSKTLNSLYIKLKKICAHE